MAYFNKNQSGGNRSFGKPRFGNDRPELHKATCATCGKSCEVPFKPNGSKSVLCRDCFRGNEGSNSRGFERSNFNRDERPQRVNDAPDYKAQFAALNAKMDKILDILNSAMAVDPVTDVEVKEILEDIDIKENASVSIGKVQDESSAQVKKEKVEKKPKKTTKKASSSKKK
ncbi:hypothetical protein HZA75_05580 [Candidatus Roizmanbacteria bacterium]|nr:hypothetical protein [Candidatus Roizmanbacteria bacterium]